MLDWWNSLTLFQTIMVCIAAPATLIIIIQMIFLLIGFGGEESFDVIEDIDVNLGEQSGGFADNLNDEGFLSLGGIRVFTLRGILAFLSVGGWLSMAMAYTMPEWLASIIGMLGGTLTAFLIALAFHYALKLQKSGNINYKLAINKIGTVYMRIPPERTGFGKINLTLQERYAEITAVTDDKEYINRGLPVKILGLDDSNTVIVERYKPDRKENIVKQDDKGDEQGEKE